MEVLIRTRHGIIPHIGIENLQRAMERAREDGTGIEIDTVLTHFHAPGLYGRRLECPADSIIVTLVHKVDHITQVLKGRCTIVDQKDEEMEVQAGAMWVTLAGTQRAIYVHEDFVMSTVHAGDYSAYEDPIDLLTFKSMAEYMSWSSITTEV